MARERGNVTILVAAIVVFVAMSCLGLAQVGRATSARARADAAADAAALASADALALGQSPTRAQQTARAIAAKNDARLISCTVRANTVDVEVEVDGAHAQARAVIG